MIRRPQTSEAVAPAAGVSSGGSQMHPCISPTAHTDGSQHSQLLGQPSSGRWGAEIFCVSLFVCFVPSVKLVAITPL